MDIFTLQGPGAARHLICTVLLGRGPCWRGSVAVTVTLRRLVHLSWRDRERCLSGTLRLSVVSGQGGLSPRMFVLPGTGRLLQRPLPLPHLLILPEDTFIDFRERGKEGEKHGSVAPSPHTHSDRESSCCLSVSGTTLPPAETHHPGHLCPSPRYLFPGSAWQTSSSSPSPAGVFIGVREEAARENHQCERSIGWSPSRTRPQ